MTTQTSTYFVTYSVLADGRYEALMKAGAMLRSTVRVVGETEAEQGIPGWWDVTFLLAEEYESLVDPIHENHSDDPTEGTGAASCPTCSGIDHAPDATYATEGVA